MNKRLKRVMLLSGTYIVLMAILLVGVSTAKYTKSIVAYSSFGTAGYNLLLLSSSDADSNVYQKNDGSVAQFGKTLLASDYMPGMKYTGVDETNTAKIFPFQVANGTTEEDASDISLDYGITLRTTCNLPLIYKLMLGTTVYTANDPVPLDKDGNRVTDGTPDLDANGIAWYEWTFRDIGNTEEGTEEVTTPPVFSLSGGKVDSNTHALIVEWPVTTADDGTVTGNEQSYMDEIELLEVRVSSAARDNTTEEPDETGYVFEDRDYSEGFILLDPEESMQVYEVDYRAFRQAESLRGSQYNAWQYDFTVDNGSGSGDPAEENTAAAQYKVSILAPMMWLGEDGTGSCNYVYGLWKEERTEEEPYGTGNYLLRRCLEEETRKYDRGTGAYETVVRPDITTGEGSAEIIFASAEDSSCRYYRKLDFAENVPGDTDVESTYSRTDNQEAVYTLENTEEIGGVTVAAARSDSFHLEISGPSSFPGYLQMYGKLLIVVEKVG